MVDRYAGAEPLRYFAAVAIGLVADMALAYGLRAFAGAPAVVCGAAGFCLGVVVNYLNFEAWVFGQGRWSWRGFARLFAAAQGALAVRLGAVWLLATIGLPSLAVFGGAVALSFVVNFLLSRMAIRGARQRGA